MTTAEQLYESALNRLHEYVAVHPMRYSEARLKVLESACGLEQPFTAEQLSTVCVGTQRVAMGTVYNALNLFIKAGIVHANERQWGKNVTSYEVVLDNPTHMQLVCERCGRTAEFHDKAIERIVRNKRLANFEKHHFTLIVYGKCRKCKTV